MNHMAVTKGTVTRTVNTPSVLLQARIDPALKDEIAAAAAESGVSTAYYLEALLRAQMAEGFLPRIAPTRTRQQLELPISDVA